VNGFVVDAAVRESVSQIGMAAVGANTGSQPRVDQQNRASQAPARLIRNGQARNAMRVEFPARFITDLFAPQQGIRANNLLDDCQSSTGTHIPLDKVADQPIDVLHFQRQATSFRVAHY